jgi:hypothetical protein
MVLSEESCWVIQWPRRVPLKNLPTHLTVNTSNNAFLPYLAEELSYHAMTPLWSTGCPSQRGEQIPPRSNLSKKLKVSVRNVGASIEHWGWLSGKNRIRWCEASGTASLCRSVLSVLSLGLDLSIFDNNRVFLILLGHCFWVILVLQSCWVKEARWSFHWNMIDT